MDLARLSCMFDDNRVRLLSDNRTSDFLFDPDLGVVDEDDSASAGTDAGIVDDDDEDDCASAGTDAGVVNDNDEDDSPSDLDT